MSNIHGAAPPKLEIVGSPLLVRPSLADCIKVSGLFHMEHWRDGRKIDEDDYENLWTTAGKNFALDTVLAGSAYTTACVMGLKGAGTAVIADTQASHASWSEQGLANAPTYSGSRKTPAFSAASAGSKAMSAAASFAITSSGTVSGSFLNLAGSATVDNTTGTLFSVGDFTGGTRAVINGDTLTVTWTGTLS